jgi:mannose-6-phosphate isomerase
VQPIVRLIGAIQNYPWGSRSALAELLGGATPSDEPQAELWLGAHPNGEALVETEAGERMPLSGWIARDPRGVLGAAVADRFGNRLPFLLKVLAVERALSLQAHPDAEQARAGFARGIHHYVDGEAKPELVVAHTRFEALSGFRPLDEIRAALERVELGALLPPHETDARGLFARWFAPPDDAERDAALARALEAARPDDPAEALMRELATHYPRDPGVLAPLLLHRIALAPGEGLFLEAGELHCYLGGVAAEIMAASDNVLRAGLTGKPLAVDELRRIGHFAPRPPDVLRASESAPGVRTWRVPAPQFELGAIDVGPGDVSITAREGVEILLCHAGEVRVVGGPVLRRGETCLVPAAAGSYRLEGAGRLYRAGVPAIR